MRLVVVESPNKTKKIREFLGADYRVAASFGHVRDLPDKGGLAVAFRAGKVLPHYVALERASRSIAELQALAGKADEILLATDPDREGEAIAWHIAALLGPAAAPKLKRVVFHAITRAEVLKAIAAPRAIDVGLVDAQQARRVLDRVVGWLVSPTLRGLGKDAKSAGRVQSVALRFVADREREIAAFSAKDYFVLDAKLERAGSPPPFVARLITWKGEPLAQRLVEAETAERTVAWCRKQRWQVAACDRREQVRRPPPPFTTATVQQAASVRLHLAPEATMKLLQSLFEGGHITYHRTDSTALTPEAIAAARAVIQRDFKPAYLPAQPVVHATKAVNAQEAHEAIRPTHPETGADALKAPGQAVSAEEAELYRLIWTRFIACQMADARDQVTTLDVACAPGAWNGGPMGVFQAKGVVPLFDGWRKLGGDAVEDDKPVKKKRRAKAAAKDQADGDLVAAGADEADESDEPNEAAKLPLLDPGMDLTLLDLIARKRSTRPPPRYTQASLIKRLERDGIGRPSTYAAILKVILLRGYVDERARKLHATDLGMKVTDFLCRRYAGNFIEPDFTRRMEETLDEIARGEKAWEPVVTAASEHLLKLARAAGLWYDPLHDPPAPTG